MMAFAFALVMVMVRSGYAASVAIDSGGQTLMRSKAASTTTVSVDPAGQTLKRSKLMRTVQKRVADGFTSYF